MLYQGTARLDRRTKDLAKRLGRNDIAVVDHADMDRVSAESLVETGVQVVVNASPSISGVYPNLGPLILTRAGVNVIDDVGQGIFEKVSEGQTVSVTSEGEVLLEGTVVAHGVRLTVESVERAMEEAKAGIGVQLDEFARNTLEFLDKERALLTDGSGIPQVATQMHDRPVVVVVRGYDYKADLGAIMGYIREVRPVLIGVDGGADALIEAGLRPHVIIGDMDSVSDSALRSGAELVVHTYADDRPCPGLERLRALGLHAHEWPLAATSEDLALLLAYEAGADLVVALGTHNNLVEYLDKGRKGMASSFLVRLKVGPKLIDAKGVSKLYRTTVKPTQLLFLVFSALVTITVVLMVSSRARTFITLITLKVRALLGL